MIRIKNLTQYFRYDPKKTDLVFYRKPHEEAVLVQFDLNPVGPVVVRVHGPDEKKGEPGPTWLVGVFVEAAAIQFAVPFAAARVTLEAEEAWVRRPVTVAAAENPNPDVTFTRMEKAGIDMDEISVALHRQAVLNRIQNGQRSSEQTAYTNRLERALADLSERIDTMQAERNPPPPVVQDE